MNITIIGAGNMGRGIGTRAAAGGHSVTFVDANPETAQSTAQEVKKAAKNGSKISASSLGEVELGDVVVLAVWYGTNIETVKQLGSRLAGKVVVDIANPLNSTTSSATGAGAAITCTAASPCARKVVRSVSWRATSASRLARNAATSSSPLSRHGIGML